MRWICSKRTCFSSTTFGKAFWSDVYGVKDFPNWMYYWYMIITPFGLQNSIATDSQNKTIITALKGLICVTGEFRRNDCRKLDWWETATLPDFGRITAAPSRDFSGRSIQEEQKLWLLFVLNLLTSRFQYLNWWFGSHFKSIGEKFFSFDFLLCLIGTIWKRLAKRFTWFRKNGSCCNRHCREGGTPLHIGENLFCLFIHEWACHQIYESWRSKLLFKPLLLIGKPAAYLQPAKYSSWWNLDKCKYGIAFVL